MTEQNTEPSEYVEVTASQNEKNGGAEVTGQVYTGNSLDEFILKYGIDVAFHACKTLAKTRAQSAMTSWLNHKDPEKRVAPEGVQVRLEAFTLSVGRRRKSLLDKALDALQGATPEERAQVLKQLELEV